MRVIFLTQYFPPEVGAPQTRIAELAAGLRRRGADVAVHTGFPHYPDGVVPHPYRIRPLTRERGPDGTRIVRSAVYPAANRGFVRRLLGHLSLAGTALVTASAAGPADVVVVESPSLFLAGAAIAYAAGKRARLVVHVADLWPESAVALGVLRHPLPIALARRLEAAVYAAADAIAVPTEGMVERLGAHPAAAGKVVHMPPAVDLDRFPAGPPPAPDRPLRVVYAGTVGIAHRLETLVEAARLLGPETVHVTIVGDGADREAVVAHVRERAVRNVVVRGRIPAAEVPGLYASAHAGAVLLRDRPLFAGALPTKLLECMAAARPVVLAARGESARLVSTSGAGVVVTPEEPGALAGALRALAADPAGRARMGAQGAEAARAYGRAGAIERWSTLLEDVVSAPGGRRTRRAFASRRR